MIKLDERSIVYVACPALKKTGGTELAHQLVAELNSQGVEAYIYYYDWDNNGSSGINDEFRKYVSVFKVYDDILDNGDNLIIVPEINITLLDKFNELKKAIWWMSVDNYKKNNGIVNASHYYGIFKALKMLLGGRIGLRQKLIPKECIHFYQSWYSKVFLESNGIENLYELSDYINDIFFSEDSSKITKENIVLYNPKKGFSFTRKIIDKLVQQNVNLRCVPVENMSTEEVRNLLGKSKVYIDFGNHPGKDRFPREAAISGCCILTCKKGSARYQQDVCIPEEYKFKDEDKNIDSIISTIKICVNDYENKVKDFEEYREFISKEHESFTNNVSKIFVE
ncbi:MAG: hypothetical protein ABF991_05215 [Liquorilactobacillus hordei]|uniref:hypothetical protein n=1 Tax=Liquorilactobacillus hordei TaxID=468911 RepID=UPI0039E78088